MDPVEKKHSGLPLNLGLFLATVLFLVVLIVAMTPPWAPEKTKPEVPKSDSIVLWIEEAPGSIRVRVEPPTDRETIQQLKEYLDKFPSAKVRGMPLL